MKRRFLYFGVIHGDDPQKISGRIFDRQLTTVQKLLIATVI